MSDCPRLEIKGVGLGMGGIRTDDDSCLEAADAVVVAVCLECPLSECYYLLKRNGEKARIRRAMETECKVASN